MQYRQLGKSGLTVSAIGLGSWATIGDTLDEKGSVALLETACDLGINLFDTAETYVDGAAEQMLGRAIKLMELPRETYVVCGKLFYGTNKKRPGSWGLSRKHIFEGCESSLRRLGMDHLDVLLCHRYDPVTPLMETVRAMSDLVSLGRIHYWGTSEWTPAQVLEAHNLALKHGFVPPLTEQLQHNFLEHQAVQTTFQALRDDLGLGIMTWSPLAYGLFAGRYDEGIDGNSRLGLEKHDWLRDVALGKNWESTLARIGCVNDLAREAGILPAQFALSFVLRNRNVDCAITGASSTQQLRQTVDALKCLDTLDQSLFDKAHNILYADK